jgi:hypothetical protein
MVFLKETPMTAKDISESFLLHYGHLVDNGSYRGWVRDFHGARWRGEPVGWNLRDARCRFGLYCLASAWSRTGKWEGPVRLALAMAGEPERWLDPTLWSHLALDEAVQKIHELTGLGEREAHIPNGRNATARADCAGSFVATGKWFPYIEQTVADLNSGHIDAIEAKMKLRAIRGTGKDSEHAWDMKVHLIFRELRCAGWTGIPGEFCCVPDGRVRAVYKTALGNSLPIDHSAASQRVYRDFGDLYDLPPFFAADWLEMEVRQSGIAIKQKRNTSKKSLPHKRPEGFYASTEDEESPSVWNEPIPRNVVPTACNVITAVERFLEGGASHLRDYEKQAFRDLKFDQMDRDDLYELQTMLSGSQAQKLLSWYKEEANGHVQHLPRPILDAFWVGWLGMQNRRCSAANLYELGVGGTKNAAQAVITVGKSTGSLFGLLVGDSKPTALFMDFFSLVQLDDSL